MSTYLLLSFTEKHKGKIGIGHVGLLSNPNLGSYAGYSLTSKLDSLISKRTITMISWPKNDSSGNSLQAVTDPKASEYRGALILSYSDKVKVLEVKRNAMVENLSAKSQTAKSSTSVPVTKPNNNTARPKATSSTARLSNSQIIQEFFSDESSNGDEGRGSSGGVSSHESNNSSGAGSDDSESSPEKNPLFTSTPNDSVITMVSYRGTPNSSASSSSKRPNQEHSLNSQTSKRIRKQQEAQELRDKLDRLRKEQEEAEEKRLQEAAELTNQLQNLNEDTSDSTVSKNNFVLHEPTEVSEDLLQQIKVLNEENESLKSRVNSLEDENQSLREENAGIKANTPEVLSQNLLSGLEILKDVTARFSNNVSAGRSSNQVSTTAEMVKLSSKCQQLIKVNDLKNAMAFGLSSPGEKPLKQMIKAIMVSIWDREYMATHSIGGKKSPTDRSDAPAKPKIDADAFQAMLNFATKFWTDKHKAALDPAWVKTAIEDKLMYEHGQYKKQLSKMQTATAIAVEPDNEDTAAPPADGGSG